MLQETTTISDEELRSLTEAIQKRHGIDFSCYEQKSLKRRVTRALHIFKCSGIHALWARILKDHGFIYPFMDEISVGLTAMFRDPLMWRKLRQIVSQRYQATDSIRIWHAGCSTGEEVYTMAVVLTEADMFERATTLATDISTNALETAKKGKYNLLKFDEYKRNYWEYNPAGSLMKYFTETESEGKMDTALIRKVKFEYHNLITSDFHQQFDIIFCRNVMIYFDNDAKRKLFEKFYKSLRRDGLLIIGFYDAVLPLVDRTRYKIIDIDSKIFQRVE